MKVSHKKMQQGVLQGRCTAGALPVFSTPLAFVFFFLHFFLPFCFFPFFFFLSFSKYMCLLAILLGFLYPLHFFPPFSLYNFFLLSLFLHFVLAFSASSPFFLNPFCIFSSPSFFSLLFLPSPLQFLPCCRRQWPCAASPRRTNKGGTQRRCPVPPRPLDTPVPSDGCVCFMPVSSWCWKREEATGRLSNW